MKAARVGDDDATTGGTVRGPRPRGGRWWRRLGVGVLLLLALFAGGLCAGWALTPSVAGAPGRVASRLAAHQAMPMTSLPHPDKTGQALVATEDSRFYLDPGVDPLGMVRGVLGLIDGHDTGGAGLDQQLAKMLYTPGDDAPGAQAEQVMLALKIDAHYGKPAQLRMYENTAYFGHGLYGLPAAARGYFHRTPARLSWAQASMLAGVVQAPSAYDPLNHLALARARQHHVLDRLVATGTLTPAQARSAAHRRLHLTGDAASG